MYHDSVEQLATRLLAKIRRHNLLKPGDRVGVAVSGGADSVALLRLLLELRDELGVVLSVVHFNHQLRGAESDADQTFVEELARHHALEIQVGSENVSQQAAAAKKSIEHTARDLRYRYFESLICKGTLNKVATGHTLDDQAETVLMHVIRGTGLQGLAGIRPQLDVDDVGEQVCGAMVRPMLGIRRREVEAYLRKHGQSWREDSSNSDVRFTRNRLRRELMPALETRFNAEVAGALGTLSEIAQGEERYWEEKIEELRRSICQFEPPQWGPRYSTLIQAGEKWRPPPPPDPVVIERMRQPGPLTMDITIDAGRLSAQPLAVQRRLIMHLGKSALIPMDFAHIEAVLDLAGPGVPSGKQLTLPLGWRAERQGDTLQLLTPDLRGPDRFPFGYEYHLAVPGSVAVWERACVIEAVPVELSTEPRDSLYACERLPSQLLIRNWRPGDRFHPAHTKSAKKVKELLSEKRVPEGERKGWPVVVAGDEVIWLRGFPVPSKFQPATNAQAAILIRESPL
jgi:tRNA(Ile)-lysidine synthase